MGTACGPWNNATGAAYRAVIMPSLVSQTALHTRTHIRPRQRITVSHSSPTRGSPVAPSSCTLHCCTNHTSSNHHRTTTSHHCQPLTCGVDIGLVGSRGGGGGWEVEMEGRCGLLVMVADVDLVLVDGWVMGAVVNGGCCFVLSG